MVLPHSPGPSGCPCLHSSATPGMIKERKKMVERTPGSPQDLLPTLHLEITPGGLGGPRVVSGIQHGSETCKSSTLTAVLHSSPIKRTLLFFPAVQLKGSGLHSEQYLDLNLWLFKDPSASSRSPSPSTTPGMGKLSRGRIWRWVLQAEEIVVERFPALASLHPGPEKLETFCGQAKE